MTAIDDIGVWDIPEVEYHADPCVEPSLSRSVLKSIVDESPAHAREKHPRLNEHLERQDKFEFDLGTTAHRRLIGGDAQIVVLDFDSFRTKAAREARDDVRASGRVPILAKYSRKVDAMVKAAHQQIPGLDEQHLFRRTEHVERTLVWRVGDVWLRARPDVLNVDDGVIWDYKTTGGSAHPDRWLWSVADYGYDIQAVLYCQAAEAIFGRPFTFRFLVQETSKPYAIASVALSPHWRSIAESKIERGIQLWSECLKSGRWPGYGEHTAHLEPPARVDLEWQERLMREESTL